MWSSYHICMRTCLRPVESPETQTMICQREAIIRYLCHLTPSLQDYECRDKHTLNKYVGSNGFHCDMTSVYKPRVSSFRRAVWVHQFAMVCLTKPAFRVTTSGNSSTEWMQTIEATSLKKRHLCPSFCSLSKNWTGSCPLNYDFWYTQVVFLSVSKTSRGNLQAFAFHIKSELRSVITTHICIISMTAQTWMYWYKTMHWMANYTQFQTL